MLGRGGFEMKAAIAAAMVGDTFLGSARPSVYDMKAKEKQVAKRRAKNKMKKKSR